MEQTLTFESWYSPAEPVDDVLDITSTASNVVSTGVGPDDGNHNSAECQTGKAVDWLHLP